MDPLLPTVVAVVFGALILYVLIKSFSGPKAMSVEPKEEGPAAPTTGENKQKATALKPKAAKPERSKKSETTFSHPWLAASLKGPAGTITSFDQSPNGKYLICCASDRSLFLWNTKELASNEHKYTRTNVEFDCATLVKFSPDSRSFITKLDNANSIRIFKFSKKDDGSPTNIIPAVEDFPKTCVADIISIGIDTAGNYIMTCDQETRFDVLSIRGEKLQTVDTATMKNNGAVVSPCGRFVAVSGFTPDAKVWEVQFDKGKQFTGVRRAFDLTGHKASVYCIAFSADSTRMATVSKDGTWKLWRTDVDYARGQTPFLITTGGYEADEKPLIALSPDGRTVAIASSKSLALYNGITATMDVYIENIFQGSVLHLAFSTDGMFVLCCGDRLIQVFHNVTGLRATISDLREKLISCTKNMERRLTEQLEEARKALETLGFDE